MVERGQASVQEDARSCLVGLLDDLDDLNDRAGRNPLPHVQWTPPQLAFLRNRARFKLLRTGNQFGKTWGGAAECIFRCLGEHPYREVRPGPIEAWVLCASWSQSIAIQKKVWELAPKDQLAEGTVFKPKTGFAGVQKAVEFRNGSVLRIKTVKQDTLNLESATIQYVWIDEPAIDENTWGALTKRLTRTGGDVAITMTPATTGDISWMRELAESGAITDLHFKMEPENFIPVGADEPLCTEKGEPMDAAWIEQERKNTLEWQRGVRCDGEWEYSRKGQALSGFNRAKHVVNIRAAGLLRGALEISTGIDYGEDALRTCGVTVYVDESGEHPRIFVMGEYAPTEPTTVDMDVDGLLGLLGGLGLTWVDQDYVWADKKYEGRATKKNARVYTEAVAKKLGVTGEIMPRFRVAKRGLKRDHFWPSVRFLHEAMIRPDHFYVDESCTWLIKALETWDGTAKHKAKDSIDALRYALRHLWGKGGNSRNAQTVRRKF